MAPEQILLIVLVTGVILYTLFGGADFGVGVWEFGTAFQSSEKEREYLYRAIGPVWEANHVWLIFVLVILFGAFPLAFAEICRALWLPLLIALVGIVFRGVGFAFRSYAAGMMRQQAIWGTLFSIASTATPFFLGAAFGAMASGKMQTTGWISPFSVYSAFFFVGVCAYISAVYLTREAKNQREKELEMLWRSRSLTMGVWLGILSLVGLVIIKTDAPILWNEFRQHSWSFVSLSFVFGNLSLWGLWKGKLTAATICSQLAIVSVILGWSVAQYPILIWPGLTMAMAKSPEPVLWAMIWGLSLGSILLVPSLVYLFYLFKGKRPQA